MVWEPCQIFEISQFMDFGFLFCHLLWQVKKSLQFFTERDRLYDGIEQILFFPQSSCIKNWPESFYIFFSPWQSYFYFVHMPSEILHPLWAEERKEFVHNYSFVQIKCFSEVDCGLLSFIRGRKISFSTFCPFSTN